MIVPAHGIEVLENQEPGVVYTVLAFDMDTGNNGAVKYHIIGKYCLIKIPPMTLTKLTHCMVIILYLVSIAVSAKCTPS